MSLLAVDIGLRAGLAMYDRDGRLMWYRSTNFGSMPRLKRGLYSVLKAAGEVEVLALDEGDVIADAWRKEGKRRHLRVIQVGAETWRRELLIPRLRRSGSEAKQAAGELAAQVIEWAGARRPTSLRHDAAEAILLGLWAVVRLGWLWEYPADMNIPPKTLR